MKEQNGSLQKSLADLGVQVVTTTNRQNTDDSIEDGLFGGGGGGGGPRVAVAAAPTLTHTRAKFVGGGFNLSQPAT